jgi:hypothetical protein
MGAISIAGFKASAISFEDVVMGVSMTPGHTQFTRMLFSE